MDIDLRLVDGTYQLTARNQTITANSLDELSEIVGMMSAYLGGLDTVDIYGQGLRSGSWSRVRRTHLETHNCCAACGSQKSLNVHHIVPFAQNPELELDPNNLITLCFVCHFWFGHLKNWQSYNEKVVQDSLWYREKLGHRPQS